MTQSLLSAATCSISPGRGHHGTHLPKDAMPGSIPYVRLTLAPHGPSPQRCSPGMTGATGTAAVTPGADSAALLAGKQPYGEARQPGHRDTRDLPRPGGHGAAPATCGAMASATDPPGTPRRPRPPPALGRLPARPSPRRRRARPRGSHRLAAAGCRPSGCTRAPAPRSAGCSGPWLGTAPCWRAGSRRRRGTEGGTGGRGAPAAPAAARGPGAEGGMAGAGARAPEQPRAGARARELCPGAGARAGGAGASWGSAPAAARDRARPRPASA